MSTAPVTADSVLRLLRQLPPRERLRVVMQTLPESDRDLPPTTRAADFWCGPDVRVLAEQQGVQPVDDFSPLLGGWPEDEPIDDFLAAVREWRRQNPAKVRAQ
jgi:hypothetical protein